MDTSEIYIKMCERAPKEIQDMRPLKNYLRYNDGDILFAHWPDGTSYPVEKRERRLHVYTIIGNNPEQYSKPIWLPTQDQLQSMVFTVSPKTALDTFHLLAFMQFAYDEMDCVDSMEQLWLAFVMAEKHGKYWTDEAWKSRETHQD